jgi:hypothetical protein
MRIVAASLILLGMLTSCSSSDTAKDLGISTQAAMAPTVQPTATAEAPAAALAEAPTPTFVPTARVAQGQEPAAPQAPPLTAPPPEQPTAAQATITSSGAATEIRLEDTAWSGGWRNRGASVYGGRTATWIYGSGTRWNTMQASFDLQRAPGAPARLTIQGMDSEDEAKTRIEIVVNGRQIFAGPDPLPNDDLPLASGTWSEISFDLDASILQAGQNTISIRNRSPGPFGRPPFFMLDYATISFGSP